jgi:hypothetical protein
MAEKRVIELEVKTTGADESEKSVKSLKARLRELKLELQGLDEGSDQFKKLVREAGELQDTIGDLNQQVKNFASDTRRLDAALEGVGAVAGAFGAVESSLALVGVESEELQETMIRLQAAMTLVNSVQAIANALQKESALMTSISTIRTNLLTKSVVQQAVATGTATTAQKIMNTVMKANPIGLIITGIVALTTAMYAFSKATEEATEDYSKFREEASKQVKQLSIGHDELNKKLEHEIALMKTKGATDKEIAQQELKNLVTLENDRKKRLEEALMLRFTLLNQLDYARKNGTEAEIEASKKEFDTNKETIKNLIALRVDYSRQRELLTIEANKKEIKAQKEHVENYKINEQELWDETLAGAKLIDDADLERQKAKDEQEAEMVETLSAFKIGVWEYEAKKQDDLDKERLAKQQALRDAQFMIAQSTVDGLNSIGQLFIKDQKKLEKFQKATALVQIGVDTAKAISSLVAASNANPTNAVTFGAAGIAQFASGLAGILANIAKAKQILTSGGNTSGAGGGSGGGSSSTPNQVITPNFNLVGQSGANSLGLQNKPLQAYVVSGEVTSQQALDRNRLKNATFG